MKRKFKAVAPFSTLANIFLGEYVGKDSEGVSYRDKYLNLVHATGRDGFREDTRNIARDMHKALKTYEQKRAISAPKN